MSPAPTQSPYPQLPLDEAIDLAIAVASPLPAERIALELGAGRVLVDAVVAPEPMPPFPSSARDGYAVRASDGRMEREVIGEAVAGDVTPLCVRAGTAARITTGAPIPEGADAVVMVEHTDPPHDGYVNIHHQMTPGENIRQVGQDYAEDERLLDAGHVLGPAELGLLASVGADHVAVHGVPRVAVFSSGDELVDPADRPAPRQIRDGNGISLATAVRHAGGRVIRSGIIRDDAASVDQLHEAVTEADMVVTSGGVSMGHKDLIKPWLAAHGQIHFGRVRVKPGKPVTCAVVDGTAFFALPGFPVSALVAFEVFVRPALRRMAGHPQPWPGWHTVRLEHDVQHATDRVELARARIHQDGDGRLIARTTGAQGSGRLLSMSAAGGLIRLDDPAGRSAAGTAVPSLLFRPPLVRGEDRTADA